MKLLCRYILSVTAFFGIVNVYFCRINLSMAIVDMLGRKGQTGPAAEESHCQGFGSSSDGNNNTASLEVQGEFDWDQGERGLVLGSYYYGYTLFQVPSAWLAAKFGFKRTFGYSMLMASFLTFTFPWLVRINLYLGVLSRSLLGIFHAVSFPSMSGAWGAWAPPLERTQLNGITVSGASAGTCIIFFLAGGVIDWLGWDSIFYLTGAVNLVWVLAWFYLVYDTPEQHPRISKEEKEYITESIGKNGYRSENKTPWKSILLSAPVWGIVLGHAASNWGNYTLNQQLPTYLNNVLRFDLGLTGLLSSLCYVLQWAVCVLASWLTDWLRKKEVISTLWIRRVNTMVGLWVTGLCIVLAGYAGCSAGLAILLLFLSTGLNTFTVPGCKSSMLDIAPAYSGIIFGLSNTISNIPGFVAPQLVGAIIQDSTIAEWRTVFWVTAGVHVVGSFLFLIKGEDQLQDWAKSGDQNQEKNVTKDKDNFTSDIKGC